MIPGTIEIMILTQGVDGLAKQLVHANFPSLFQTMIFSENEMHNKTIPYKIFKKGNIKIGVTGVGIEMAGLVPTALYNKTVYNDPIANAQNGQRG